MTTFIVTTGYNTSSVLEYSFDSQVEALAFIEEYTEGEYEGLGQGFYKSSQGLISLNPHS